jgi:predicted transcriptional regulator YheO
MINKVLEHYKILVDFLGKALGPDYEIALHDLKDTSNSIIAIANSHISGRTIGAPLTNKMLQILAEEGYKNTNYITHYAGISSGKKPLRSNTFFLKDEHGKPFGLLCIIFDDTRYNKVIDDILKLCHPDEFVHHNTLLGRLTIQIPPEEQSDAEVFPNSITDVMENIVSTVIDENHIPADRLTQEEKLQIVDILNKKGVFSFKGAVSYVANKLCCSEASIYRYLSKLSK